MSGLFCTNQWRGWGGRSECSVFLDAAGESGCIVCKSVVWVHVLVWISVCSQKVLCSLVFVFLAKCYYVTFGYWHRSSICRLWSCNIFAPYCSAAIWLLCDENSTIMFAHVLLMGVILYMGVWNIKNLLNEAIFSITLNNLDRWQMELWLLISQKWCHLWL